MKALVIPLFVVVVVVVPARVSASSSCPVGLPFEVHVDCIVAESAADTQEFCGKAPFSMPEFDLSARLQAWVDTQMIRSIVRDEDESSESSAVAGSQNNR